MTTNGKAVHQALAETNLPTNPEMLVKFCDKQVWPMLRQMRSFLNSHSPDTRVNVRWEGAKGDGITDDTAAINRATLKAFEQGGGQVFVPSGTYLISGEITLYDNVYLVGEGIGATTITSVGFSGDSVAAFPNQANIFGIGSTLLLDTPSGNLAQGDTSITLASDQSANVSSGDYVFIYNVVDYSFSSARSYYKAGEFCQVRNVSGATLTLNAPLFAPYRYSGTFTAVAATDLCTSANHNLANTVSDPVELNPEAVTLTTTNTLPGGLSAGTTYYIVREYTYVALEDPTTDVFTATGHGFANGDNVRASDSSTMPGGLTAFVPYYIVNAVAGVSFQLSLTSGGAAIDITSSGAGVLTIHRALSAPLDTFHLSLTPGGSPVNITGVGVGVHTFTKVRPVKVYKLEPIHTGVRAMSVRGFSTVELIGLISVRYGAKLDFADLDLTGSDYFGLTAIGSVNVSADNIRMFDHTPTAGYNFGIEMTNCQNVRVSNCDISVSRCSVDFGGGDFVGAVVCRDWIVSDSILGSTRLGNVSTANMHGNNEWGVYRNCIVRGGYLSGDHMGFEGCTIYAGTSQGEAIYVTEPVGFDFWLKDCTLVATGNVATDTGLVAGLGMVDLQRTGETFLIENCAFKMGPYNGHSWRIQQDSGTTYDISVAIVNCRCTWDTTHANNFGMFFAVAGKAFRNIDLDNVLLDNGYLSLQSPNAERVTLNRVRSYNSSSYGLVKGANTVAVWTTERMSVTGCFAYRAAATGMLFTGQSQTYSILEMAGNSSLNNVQGAPAGNATDSSMYANTWLHVTQIGNQWGDEQSVQTQTYLYGGDAVTTWDEDCQKGEGAVLLPGFSSVNVFRTRIQVNSVSTAPVQGLLLENVTAAANAAQQYSPGLDFVGRGWDSVASSSKEVRAQWQLEPLQAAGTPGGSLCLRFQLDGGSYNTNLRAGSDGTLKISTGLGVWDATPPAAQPARPGQIADATTGASGASCVDVGAVPLQANINNNFATILDRLNKIEAALSEAGGGVGVTA